ncbi:glycoside hydrolase superfamily [Blakeslea trispora]|nr:glycoside hydrolase superfamily [Blakeslea trispora]
MILIVLFSLLTVTRIVFCEFNATSNSNRLSFYCDNDDNDILVISFLHQFGQQRSTSYDISNTSKNCKGMISGTQLLDCPEMEEDIKYCQSKNKKILLSMGGATPTYGLESTKEGEDLANELWNTFGAGKSESPRPFGTAVVDGFDLDIENGDKMGYTAFVNKMRQNYETDPSKTYYISAAPQCPFPDYYVGDVLDNTWVDFVMIQFYNNVCIWAKSKSKNKNVRLFVGIPGSPTAAGRGYVPYTELVSKITPLKSTDYFGGVMVWDISQAYANTADVLPNYASGIARLIKGLPPLPSSQLSLSISATPSPTLSSTLSSTTSSALSFPSNAITSSSSHSLRTLTLKRNVTTTSTQLVISTLIDQTYESVITDDQMTTYTPSISSSTLYDGTTTIPETRVTPSVPTVLPVAGQPCYFTYFSYRPSDTTQLNL